MRVPSPHSLALFIKRFCGLVPVVVVVVVVAVVVVVVVVVVFFKNGKTEGRWERRQRGRFICCYFVHCRFVYFGLV